MQVLMNKNELKRIRWTWFKGGFIFAIVIFVALGVMMYSRLQTASDGVRVSSEFKTVQPQIITYSTVTATYSPLSTVSVNRKVSRELIESRAKPKLLENQHEPKIKPIINLKVSHSESGSLLV
jgi:uncharacterized membrane protein YukC